MRPVDTFLIGELLKTRIFGGIRKAFNQFFSPDLYCAIMSYVILF